MVRGCASYIVDMGWLGKSKDSSEFYGFEMVRLDQHGIRC
jgi:hypothetical protein